MTEGFSTKPIKDFVIEEYGKGNYEILSTSQLCERFSVPDANRAAVAMVLKRMRDKDFPELPKEIVVAGKPMIEGSTAPPSVAATKDPPKKAPAAKPKRTAAGKKSVTIGDLLEPPPLKAIRLEDLDKLNFALQKCMRELDYKERKGVGFTIQKEVLQALETLSGQIAWSKNKIVNAALKLLFDQYGVWESLLYDKE